VSWLDSLFIIKELFGTVRGLEKRVPRYDLVLLINKCNFAIAHISDFND
jgi:hypothetical protein